MDELKSGTASNTAKQIEYDASMGKSWEGKIEGEGLESGGCFEDRISASIPYSNFNTEVWHLAGLCFKQRT